MAKHDVQHLCGHTCTHSLTGPQRNREFRLTRLAGEDCPDCLAAAREAAHAKANAVAAEQAKAQALPTLTGTERQIGWATTLRQGLIAQLGRGGVHLEKHEDSQVASLAVACQPGGLDNYAVLADALSDTGDEKDALAADAIHAVLSLVRQQTAASWWIDNRDRLTLNGAADLAAKWRVAREAELAKQLRNEELHAFKKDVRRRVREIFPSLDGWTIKVGSWGARKDEKRVYFGLGFNDNIAILHVTGDDRYPPGSLNLIKKVAADKVDALKELLAEIARKWKTFDVSDRE